MLRQPVPEIRGSNRLLPELNSKNKKFGLEIVWTAEVGRQSRNNSPSIMDGEIVLGGKRQHQSSYGAGFYCLDKKSGVLRWHFETKEDATITVFQESSILGGTQSGEFYSLDSMGNVKWKTVHESEIFATPEIISCDGALIIVLFLYSGSVKILSFATGEELDEIYAGDNLRASAVAMPDKTNSYIIVSENGKVVEVTVENSKIRTRELGSLHYPDVHKRDGESTPKVYGKPLIVGDTLIVGFARQTYYSDPPVIAFDISSGEILWHASDPMDRVNHYGNACGEIIEYKNSVAVSVGYSNELILIDAASGVVASIVPAGRSMFPQWASGAIQGETVWLPRQDGYLHKISLEKRKRIESIYLGDKERAGRIILEDEDDPEADFAAVWSFDGVYDLFSKPNIDGEYIYVGTDEGVIYCIRDRPLSA